MRPQAMLWIVVFATLVPVLAHAELDAAEPSAPMTAVVECMLREAQGATDPEHAERLLHTLPDCEHPERRERPTDAGARRERRGLTAEAHVGVGVVHLVGYDGMSNRETRTFSGVGLNGSVGYFVSPWLAVAVRVTGLRYGDRSRYAGFVGPSAQLWLASRLWVGSGIGVAARTCADCAWRTNLGLDGRVGVALREDGTGINIGLELISNPSASLVTAAVLVGYQGF